MRQNISLNEYHNRAKIIGAIFILIGIGFFLYPSNLNIKIGFASIIIGFFMIFIIAVKSVPEKISDIQIEGSIDAVKKIISELKLKGNAVFLPKDENLDEERILIPYNKSEVIKIPKIDKNDLFLIGPNREVFGISIPPSGIKFLKDEQIDKLLKNTDITNLEEKLQKLIGMDIVKSLSLTKWNNEWRLELEKPTFCSNDRNLCTKYPCPTCSAIITAIARIANGTPRRLWIKDVTHNGQKVIFHLYFIDKIDRKADKTC